MREPQNYEGAYSIPMRRKPRPRSAYKKCIACDGDVEAWAAPLDDRAPWMCDNCQRLYPTPRFPGMAAPVVPEKTLPIFVVLNAADIEMATAAGGRRFARRRAQGSEHKWARHDIHSEEKEVEAIGAEIAVARVIRREWVDTDEPDYDGDVGEGVQVRHTAKGSRLILHPEDKDDHAYFLTIGVFPSFDVAGWMWGREGKKQEYWMELQPGRPAFCIVQSLLRPSTSWSEPTQGGTR